MESDGSQNRINEWIAHIVSNTVTVHLPCSVHQGMVHETVCSQHKSWFNESSAPIIWKILYYRY